MGNDTQDKESERALLKKCFSNNEDEELSESDFNMMSKLMPVVFKQAAQALNVKSKNFTLFQLRAILIQAAASMTIENVENFKPLNKLLSDYSDEIFKKSVPDDHNRKLIKEAEISILPAIYFAADQKNWGSNKLIKDKEKSTALKMAKDKIKSTFYDLSNTNAILTDGAPISLSDQTSQSPEVQQFARDDHLIKNFGDKNVKDGSIVLMPDKEGKLKAFQAKHLLVKQGSDTTGYKGLTCIAYTSLDQNSPEVKVFFEPTSTVQQGLLDAQRHAPGARTMKKADEILLQEVGQMVSELHDKTGKKVAVSVLGHSLGGANAQSFASSLIAAKTLQDNGNHSYKVFSSAQAKLKGDPHRDEILKAMSEELPRIEGYPNLNALKHISAIDVHTKNAPRTSASNARLAAGCAVILQSDDSGKSVPITHHLSRTGDIVSRAGEEFLGANSTAISVVAMKWNTGKKSWSEKHNVYLSEQKMTSDEPLRVVYLLDSNQNADKKKLATELSKGLGTGHRVTLLLGSGLERGISRLAPRGSITEYHQSHSPISKSSNPSQTEKPIDPAPPPSRTTRKH